MRLSWCLLLVFVGVGAGASISAAAVDVSPGILSVVALPRAVPAGGGTVLVTVRVRNATSCTFTNRRGLNTTVPCSLGEARVVVTLAPNRLQSTQQLRYLLYVSGTGARSVEQQFFVTQLGPSRAANAVPVPTVTTSSPVPDIYTASVAVSGGTPTPVAPAGTVNLHSNNWSGYSATGGPFTVATGSFSVPSLAASPGTATTSEWVGVHGRSPKGGALIQAGVTESYDASTQLVNTYAWWEILPSSEAQIPLSVAPGDQITVTIAQVSPGLWGISLVDNTTGQSFSLARSYALTGTSADWIVEAPTSASTGVIDTLGQFTQVAFSDLGVTGTTASMSEWWMLQGGAMVSSPSPLTGTGFNVAYGAVVPGAPA